MAAKFYFFVQPSMDFPAKWTDLTLKYKGLKPESFTWKDFNRVPQTFRRKARVGSYTCDEDFDILHKNLGILEANLKTLIKYSESISVQQLKQLVSSVEVGDCFNVLFDPYNTFSQKTRAELKTRSTEGVAEEMFNSPEQSNAFLEEYKHWELSSEYVNQMKDLQVFIVDPKELSKLITNKCKICLSLIENIKSQIKTRNNLLDDYDLIYNQLEALILKGNSETLTPKEAQTKFNLERKLEFSKSKYEVVNNLFKKELPIFFKLAKSFLQPILFLLFFHQLSFSYQVTFNLQNFERELDKHSRNQLVSEIVSTHKCAQKDIDKLNIAQFRDNYYKDLTSFTSNQFQKHYVKALYLYKAIEEGDLTFEEGDLIEVLEDDGNWWKGRLNGVIGIFPSSYCLEIG